MATRGVTRQAQGAVGDGLAMTGAQAVVPMGQAQEGHRGGALRKRIETNTNPYCSPEVGRQDKTRIVPASSCQCSCGVLRVKGGFLSFGAGRNGSVDEHTFFFIYFLFTPTLEVRKMNSNEKPSQRSHYCVFKHFLYA